jgi:hypothetical protein
VSITVILAEIDAEISRLEQAKQLLSPTTAKRGPGRPKGSAVAARKTRKPMSAAGRARSARVIGYARMTAMSGGLTNRLPANSEPATMSYARPTRCFGLCDAFQDRPHNRRSPPTGRNQNGLDNRWGDVHFAGTSRRYTHVCPQRPLRGIHPHCRQGAGNEVTPAV